MFEKGNEFGKISSRALTPEIKVLLKVSKESLIPALMRITSLTYPELKILEKDDEAPAIDIYIARCLVKGISKGDPYFLQFIFDRILGKAKQTIEMPEGHNEPLQITIVERTNDRTVQTLDS